MLKTKFKENQPIYFIKNNELFIIKFQYGDTLDYEEEREVIFFLIKGEDIIYKQLISVPERRKNDIGPVLRYFISLYEKNEPIARGNDPYLFINEYFKNFQFPSNIKGKEIDQRILKALQIIDEYYPDRGLSFTDLVVSVDAQESLVERRLNRLRVRQIIKYEASVFKIADYDKADEYLNKIEKQTKKEIDPKILKDFKQKLLKLNDLNPQERGYQFEKLLQEIFELFDLTPRPSFKLIGEQIDGSIELDNHTYLVEAKWQNKPVDEKELLAFHGKIEGKAKWSRGLFINYSGFTDDALKAFVKGKTINLIAMDGLDLFEVLDGKIRLDELIKLKSRYAAETGNIMARADDLVHLYLKRVKEKEK